MKKRCNICYKNKDIKNYKNGRHTCNLCRLKDGNKKEITKHDNILPAESLL